MKLVTWNINHRAQQARIPASMARAIGSLEPDVVVLTEYVPGPTRQAFRAELAASGLEHQCLSPRASGQNHVLIASRVSLERGIIRAPGITPAVPSNALHVLLPDVGVEILGLRVPDFSRNHRARRQCWDWILATAGMVKDWPFVMLGDFNRDPSDPGNEWGSRINQLAAEGWQLAAPPSGASYWGPGGRVARLDHALVSVHFAVRGAQYVVERGPYLFAGTGQGALSDHAPLLIDIAPLWR